MAGGQLESFTPIGPVPGTTTFNPMKSGPAKFGVKPPKPIVPPKGAIPHNFTAGPVRPTAQVKALAPKPSAGVVAPGTSSSPSSGGHGALPPLDAQGLSNVANYIFKANESANALSQQQTGLSTNYQAQMAQLGHQQPLDQLKLMTGSNDRGGLYSSAYGQQLGNLDYNYLGREGGATNAYNQKLGTLASRISGIEGGIPIFEGGQAAASAGRESSLAARSPAAAQPAAPPTKPPGKSNSKGNKGRLASSLAKRGGKK